VALKLVVRGKVENLAEKNGGLKILPKLDFLLGGRSLDVHTRAFLSIVRDEAMFEAVYFPPHCITCDVCCFVSVLYLVNGHGELKSSLVAKV
jgi:hypothetical protein